MKTTQQLLDTVCTANLKDTLKLKLEIEQHNAQKMIETMEVIKSVLKEYKGRYIGKALKDKLMQALSNFEGAGVWFDVDNFHANLHIRARGLGYRQSWNANNESYYGVFAETIDDYLYGGKSYNEPLDAPAVVKSWVDNIDARIDGLKEKIAKLEDNIVNFDANISRKIALLKEIQEREEEIDAFGQYFNELTKYL